MNKHTVAIIVSVIFLFAIIVSLTGIAGKYFGKTTEMILLGVIAAVLLGILIKDNKDSGKNGDNSDNIDNNDSDNIDNDNNDKEQQ